MPYNDMMFVAGMMLSRIGLNEMLTWSNYSYSRQ